MPAPDNIPPNGRPPDKPTSNNAGADASDLYEQALHRSLPTSAHRLTRSREREADLALNTTAFGRGVAASLCLAFALLILAVPTVQLLAGRGRGPSLSDLSSLAEPIPTPETLRGFETALQDGSVAGRAVLPPAQAVLTRLGVGNEQAYVGRRGELLYRPDVEYVSGPGFLNAAVLARRREAVTGDERIPQPDPVPAIVDFARQLRARGITLVLMPVPVKPTLEPEALSARSVPVQNPSYGGFLHRLTGKCDVFDPSPVMIAEERRTGERPFLRTDTHWTPPAMEAAARALAGYLEAQRLLPPRPRVGYRRGEEAVANVGDVARMLRLPPGNALLSVQAVSIRPVTEPDGAPWQPRPEADVLLLGDSFSNVYSSPDSFDTSGSLGGRGWGGNAGLAEQVSFFLGRPLDSIVNNAGGSHVTREKLARQMAGDPARLSRVRVVVWEFAMRDLSAGDWRLVRLPGT